MRKYSNLTPSDLAEQVVQSFPAFAEAHLGRHPSLDEIALIDLGKIERGMNEVVFKAEILYGETVIGTATLTLEEKSRSDRKVVLEPTLLFELNDLLN